MLTKSNRKSVSIFFCVWGIHSVNLTRQIDFSLDRRNKSKNKKRMSPIGGESLQPISAFMTHFCFLPPFLSRDELVDSINGNPKGIDYRIAE
jgi:hypothetical protein